MDCIALIKNHLLLDLGPTTFVTSQLKAEIPVAALSTAVLICFALSRNFPRYLTKDFHFIINSGWKFTLRSATSAETSSAYPTMRDSPDMSSLSKLSSEAFQNPNPRMNPNIIPDMIFIFLTVRLSGYFMTEHFSSCLEMYNPHITN